MDFEIARSQPERRLRLAHRFGQSAPRGEGFRHAMVPSRQIGYAGERVPVFPFRILEQPGRPQRVAVQRHHIGSTWIALREALGFMPGKIEFGNAQRRRDHTDACRPDAGRRRRLEGVLVRVQRLTVTAFGIQQVAKLQLDFGCLRRRCGIGANDQTGSRDDDRRHLETKTAVHGPSCGPYSTLTGAGRLRGKMIFVETRADSRWERRGRKGRKEGRRL